jgi:hypothetical protein
MMVGDGSGCVFGVTSNPQQGGYNGAELDGDARWDANRHICCAPPDRARRLTRCLRSQRR